MTEIIDIMHFNITELLNILYRRCFEVNGVAGVNFVEKPCMFLRNLKNMLEEAEE